MYILDILDLFDNYNNSPLKKKTNRVKKSYIYIYIKLLIKIS